MPAYLRPATPVDLDLVEKLENAADSMLIELLKPEDWQPAVSKSERAVLPGFILVISETVRGAAVGFVQVIVGDDFAHLEQLSVLPGHGRRGHGRALVEAAKGEAKYLGRSRMTLRTFADVPWNAPFYATCGFRESEVDTGFHHRLVQVESSLGLPLLGRRIQMTACF